VIIWVIIITSGQRAQFIEHLLRDSGEPVSRFGGYGQTSQWYSSCLEIQGIWSERSVGTEAVWRFWGYGQRAQFVEQLSEDSGDMVRELSL
jgi:hypothetical protein